MTIKIAGDVGAVNAAVNAGKQIGAANNKLVSWKVIPRPVSYTHLNHAGRTQRRGKDNADTGHEGTEDNIP